MWQLIIAKMASPLDGPIFAALSTHLASLAEIEGGARAFPVDVTTLAGLESTTPAAWAGLRVLLDRAGPRGLFVLPGTPVGDGVRELDRVPLAQMIEEAPTPDPSGPDAPAIVELGEADVPEMVALAQLTQPGPFATRTRLLGTFLGVRVDGVLAAMAGQRLHLPGHREVSAVCTHPAHTKRGHAGRLMRAVAARIRADGETPILHVRASNEGAISVYRGLGYVERRRFEYVVCGKLPGP